jgi:anti-sigma B factor antagonist
MTVITLKPLDLLTPDGVSQLQTQIQGAIAAQSTGIILDLSALPFLDSAGLGELVVAYKAVRGSGARLAIAAPNDQARQLFALTDLDQVFEIYQDIAAATQALSS